MYWEKDYTKMENGEILAEEKGLREVADEDNKLALYLQYYCLWNSQFKYVISQTKKDKIFYLYKLLKKLAFIHNGKASLDINEENMDVRLVYWGDSIAALPKELDASKDILISLLGEADIVYISSVDGGIEIRIEEEFYERVEVKDEQAALSDLKEMIHNNKT